MIAADSERDRPSALPLAKRSPARGPGAAHRRAIRQRSRLSCCRGRLRHCAGAGQPVDLTRGRPRRLGGPGAAAGDLLPLRQAEAAEREELHAALARSRAAEPLPGRARAAGRLLHRAGQRTLLESIYTVSQASDRMGMRLEGPTLEHAPRATTSSRTASRRAPSRCRATASPSCCSRTGRRRAAIPRSPPSSPPTSRRWAASRQAPRLPSRRSTSRPPRPRRRQLAADIGAMAGAHRSGPAPGGDRCDAADGRNLVSGTVNARDGERSPEAAEQAA